MDYSTTANIALFTYCLLVFLGISFGSGNYLLWLVLKGKYDWMDAPSGVPIKVLVRH
jgi:hypothetical protein